MEPTTDPEDLGPAKLAELCLATIKKDADATRLLDDYLAGRHNPVYVPDHSDAEFMAIAKRSPLNMIPLIVNSVTQVCYVDAIRHSRQLEKSPEPSEGLPPEMVVWQRNRMDSRQLLLVRAFATHGMVYTVVTPDLRGESHIGIYSAAQATALFDDPVNDVDARCGMVITKGNSEGFVAGRFYDETDVYDVVAAKKGLTVTLVGPHGASRCPISRGVLNMDLDGAVTGLVGPVIETQDQINQTSFDGLTTQSWGAFKVRTATGMVAPVRRWSRSEIDYAWPEPSPDASPKELSDYSDRPNVGDPVLDENGQEMPLPVGMSQKRALIAEDPDTKFGTLDATDLGPYLAALGDRIKYLAAQSQTPPTYFMGEMANLSAEALTAAEISKTRRDNAIRMALGDLFERTLQLAMEIEGEADRAGDVGTEIVWADTDPRSLAATVDALGKMVEMLGVPPSAAWEELPGMTQGKLVHWHQLAEQWESDHPEVAMARKIDEAGLTDLMNEDLDAE